MSTPPATPAMVTLTSILDLKAARPLAEELTALRGRDLMIDAASVERLGAQCLQVLLAASATWADDGARFAVTGPSAAFLETLALLGAPYPTCFERPELAA